jgi:hypothetical protein
MPEFQFRHGGGFFNAILLPGKPGEREEDEFWFRGVVCWGSDGFGHGL